MCAECDFDWAIAHVDGVAIVGAAPDAASRALVAVGDPTRRDGARWSASMYLWHLVDVLRIGTERLLTLALDPACGIPCWDENDLAAARRYDRLSPVVGLAVLRRAASEWQDAAGLTSPDAEVDHAELGPLGALEVIRRNAHEVRHHVLDIRVGTDP